MAGEDLVKAFKNKGTIILNASCNNFVKPVSLVMEVIIQSGRVYTISSNSSLEMVSKLSRSESPLEELSSS